jgi:photosystem II stability/assembly factor-like uncharacterized protein
MRWIVLSLLALGCVAFTRPASAQWVPVPEVASTEIFSFFANGDTLAAGADTTVYVSTNSGQTWKRSAPPVVNVPPIEALLVQNGRLYAGSFGKGVFVSDDLGTTWNAFNQGLVGGFLDTQLDISDLRVRGDSIYAATSGAGVYARSLGAGGTWAPFGTQLEPNQASNVTSMALGGTRLLVMATSNGQVFFNDPGDGDWSTSDLDNLGLHPGLTPDYAKWNGSSWVVGTNLGMFRSTGGEEPWTRTDVGFGPLNWVPITTFGSRFYAAFNIAPGAIIEASDDGGATWHDEEDFPGVFIRDLGTSGTTLYAARGDGLWRRPVGSVAVAPGGAPTRLAFTLAGPQPIADQARLRFELPRASEATITVYDVHGRMIGDRVAGSWSAGPHEVSLDARKLPPGVYAAVISAGGTREALRLVRVR